MIPRLEASIAPQPVYLAFLEALKERGFAGELCPDYANRTVLATDNSIYQVLPQAVIYPKNSEDLSLLGELTLQPRFRKVVLAPRGGGTGTNGQSLTDGLVVDLSKHMNQILEINQTQRWVRVQAGVVKDQLNAALKPFGLFFAPELSTSNRATIGGMINTDASGQGSCLYGKTRDHVLELSTVLLDGTVHHSQPLKAQQLAALCEQQDRVGLIHRLISSIYSEHQQRIQERFPKLNRCLTGYDLAHIRDEQGRFNLNNILCGSEGTLGFITEAKLNLVPIPKCSALVVVRYSDFDAALRDAKRLMGAQPTSIETIDSKVLNLAMEDIVWQEVAEFFPADAQQVQGINLVEYTAEDETALRTGIERLTQTLSQQTNDYCLGHALAMGDQAVQRIWGMRKKAVGLLGNSKGEARPVPFVEDTAVPPEHLADFIREFRALLDSHKLQYGMFGHVDAGVLHVRPALDMKDPQQAKLVRVISDQVAELTQKYHGLLWGEHGKGVRSEYAPQFFGDLYPQLQRIKAAFDPFNQLNPGKIASPAAEQELLKIDGVPTRGERDRTIPVQVWQGFSEAVYCNGNGACFNWNLNDAMCPSWKATRERQHSPKGRSALMREWLTQLSLAGTDPTQALAQHPSWWQHLKSTPSRWRNSRAAKGGEYDFSHEVHEAMMGCLACKSCSGQCPIKVDVPTFRSQFLDLYYRRYRRPLKDYFVGALEYTLPLASRVPKLYNRVMGASLVEKLLASALGFVDAPKLSEQTLRQAVKRGEIRLATPATLAKLSAAQKKKTVILVQDAFTSFFETPLVLDLNRLLQKLGFQLFIAPYQPNGKPLHVHGFLGAFTKVAGKHAKQLQTLAQHQIPLIGLDPAMTLTLRSEYQKALGPEAAPKVLLVQEWLMQQEREAGLLSAQQHLFQARGEFKLLPHCTEKTNAPAALADWPEVFKALGQSLATVPVGCCGMSGTYGHESSHRETSAKIFDQSWRAPVSAAENQGKIAATGFSCRCQSKREAFVKVPHPVQLLTEHLKGEAHASAS